MNVRHPYYAASLGLVGLILGALAVIVDSGWLGLLAGIAAAAAGLVTLRRSPSQPRDGDDKANREVAELESALAAQVQARISAEEAVRSLGEQLAVAQRDLSGKVSQLDLPRAERKGDALTDAATGLFSEDYFRVAIDSRIAAARRHLRPVGVVMLEVIEGLRSGSPQPAHPVMVAEVVTATLREADTACRMVDGRFALVLEDTSENGAIWTVERIRRALNEQGSNLTLRAGIACYPAHAFGSAELLKRSESALVAARDWQQDRIEVAVAE